MVCHLKVDIVRGQQALARPALVDDVRQFGRDVDAPAVGPAVGKPARQLLRGVLVDDVDVEFTLAGEAGKGEVAAAQIADNGRDLVAAKEQVELGVQGVAQKEFDDYLAAAYLRRQPAQPQLVGMPAAQVEVAHAEIGAIGSGKRTVQGRQQRVLNIIKDTRHSSGIPSIRMPRE